MSKRDKKVPGPDTQIREIRDLGNRKEDAACGELGELEERKQEALRRLYETFFRPFYSLARRGIPGKLSARVSPSEILQSACHSFMKKVESGDEIRSPGGLFAQMVAWKRAKAIGGQNRDRNNPDREVGPIEDLSSGELLQILKTPLMLAEAVDLQNAVAALTADERVLAKALADGRSKKEIAPELGITPQAVGQRAQKMWARLRVFYCDGVNWESVLSAKLRDALKGDAGGRIRSGTWRPEAEEEVEAIDQPQSPAAASRAEELAGLVCALEGLSADDRSLAIGRAEGRPREAIAVELGIEAESIEALAQKMWIQFRNLYLGNGDEQ